MIGRYVSHLIVVFSEILTSLAFITTYMMQIQDPVDSVNSEEISERNEWAARMFCKMLGISVVKKKNECLYFFRGNMSYESLLN